MPNEQGREWSDRELAEGLKEGDEVAVRHLLARHGDTQYEVGVQFRWSEDPDRQRLNRHLSSVFKGHR